MYLNGEPVTDREYEMLVQENCNYIFMQYSNEQISEKTFWEEEIDGSIPWEQLSDRILEELKYNYALKQLAVQLDVEKDYTYEDLLENMEAENRSKTDSTEEAAYGLKSYDAASYYTYWYSDLETRVKNTWISRNADVSEADCKDYYEKHKAEEYTCETGISIWYAEIPYRSEEEEMQAQQTALSLKHALEMMESTQEVSAAFPDVSVEELELNSLDTQEGKSGVYTRRWEIASSMEKGQVYGPYEDNGACCIIKCINRTENGVLDFDLVKSRIERYLQMEKADVCIQEMTDNMEVQENREKIKAVILETAGN